MARLRFGPRRCLRRDRGCVASTAIYTNVQSSPLNMMEPYLCLLAKLTRLATSRACDRVWVEQSTSSRARTAAGTSQVIITQLKTNTPPKRTILQDTSAVSSSGRVDGGLKFVLTQGRNRQNRNSFSIR